MKKTMVSLAVASLVATSAMAADKGVDFDITGQVVVYHETKDANDNTMYSPEASTANLGVQLNGAADLGNGFALGTQLSHLSTSGLQYNFVDGVRQGGVQGGQELMVTKMHVAKKVGNTTVKLGRQELPKSLSPLAYSEGWNVFKNTFDAAVVINSDLPSTTLVLAAVDNSNGSAGTFGTRSNLNVLTQSTSAVGTAATTAEGAFMLTAQTTLIPMATVTASYYALGQLAATPDDGASALWLDAKVADKSLPMGLKVGLQYGTITAAADALPNATTAMGAKVGLAVAGANLCFAYTAVNDGDAQVRNTGTGVKTPLFTQMVGNQDHISSDNSTIMASAAYGLGDAGKVIARVGITTDNTNTDSDFTDAELIYKVNAGGMDLMVAYLNLTHGDADATNVVRAVARYNF